MSMSAGTRLGPFEILSAIGAGGMGEVYRACDTRLNRIVAIKVLPDHFADRAELRAIASLNHPHICTLFDVGRENGADFFGDGVPGGRSAGAAVVPDYRAPLGRAGWVKQRAG
jgi:Protein kinase domain